MFIIKVAAAVIMASSASPLYEDLLWEARFAYKTDTLDFSDATEDYTMYGLTARFSKETLANRTRILTEGGDKERETSVFTLADTDENYTFIAGDFYASYGSGLALGKAGYSTSDIFAGGFSASKNKIYSPCLSGNPAASLRGAALDAYIKGEKTLFRAGGHYSVRNRFAEWDSYETERSSAGYKTMAGRYTAEKKNLEPVLLSDRGGLAEIIFNENLKFQGYIFSSSIEDSRGDSFTWGWNTRNSSGSGETGYRAWGLFAEYTDKTVNLFHESALSSRNFSSEQGDENVDGRASLSGFRFKHPVFRFQAEYKDTDKKYYAPFASRDAWPLSRYILAAETTLLPELKIGGYYSSEKRKTASFNSYGLAASVRERIYLDAEPFPDHKFILSAARTAAADNRGESLNKKYGSEYEYSAIKKIKASLSGSMQMKDHYESTYLIRSGLRAGPFRGFFTRGDYSWFISSPDNPVFSGTGKWDTVSAGSYARESSHAAALLTGYSRDDWRFTAAGLVRFNGKTLYEKRWQFTGDLVY